MIQPKKEMEGDEKAAERQHLHLRPRRDHSQGLTKGKR
jgi:hypothetical protein